MLDVVSILEKGEVKVDLTDIYGNSLLHWASYRGNLDLVVYLLKLGISQYILIAADHFSHSFSPSILTSRRATRAAQQPRRPHALALGGAAGRASMRARTGRARRDGTMLKWRDGLHCVALLFSFL
jgi:ankyrin repeat protein